MKLHAMLALALTLAPAHAGGPLLPPDPGKKAPAVLPLEPAAATTPVKVPPVIPLSSPADVKVPPVIPLSPPADVKVPPVIPIDPHPSQLPSQLPAQLPPPPAQMPTQFPSQFPSQFPAAAAPSALSTPAFSPAAPAAPAASAPPTTAAPTSPTNTPADATTAAPVAMPLSIAPPALPAPTSTFHGFAMTDRSYEVLSLAIPTPVRAGASAIRGRLTVNAAGFTLANVRIAGPWSLRGQATLWQVSADAYPDGYPYRAGAIYLHVMQKTPASGQAAILDGQGWLYRTRYRMIASGALAAGGPLELPAAASPSAPHTEDLKNRP